MRLHNAERICDPDGFVRTHCGFVRSGPFQIYFGFPRTECSGVRSGANRMGGATGRWQATTNDPALRSQESGKFEKKERPRFRGVARDRAAWAGRLSFPSIPDALAGLEESALHGPRRDAEGIGDFRLRPSGHEEADNFLRLFREGIDNLPEAKDRIVRFACDTLASGQERGESVPGFRGRVYRLGAADLPAPEHIAAGVRDDRSRPMVERMRRTISIRGFEHPHERRLNRVRRVVAPDISGSMRHPRLPHGDIIIADDLAGKGFGRERLGEGTGHDGLRRVGFAMARAIGECSTREGSI